MELLQLLQSNTKNSAFKSVSKTSDIPSKMSSSCDETIVTANNADETVNLLNNYFYSMFKAPLSKDKYEDHLANNMDFIKTISY